MDPRIVILEEKKLIGYSMTMSQVNNKTGVLWRSFGPRIKEVNNRITDDKFSVQVYDSLYYENFNANTEFEKWALVEVEDFDSLPVEMKTFNLIGGLYAVFNYKGSSTDNQIFQYIFELWLPQSAYTLDNRPHFEVLGEKYINNDPRSEEEIWIPIRENSN